jgi:hypothetical protein
MPNLFSTIKTKVLKHIQRDTLKSILKASQSSKPYLWGAKQPPNHLEICVVIALYKDMFGKSYADLNLDCKFFLQNIGEDIESQSTCFKKSIWKMG